MQYLHKRKKVDASFQKLSILPGQLSANPVDQGAHFRHLGGMLGKRQEMRAIAAHAVLPGHDQFAFGQLLGHQVARYQGHAAAGLAALRLI